jgi:hypothetical protein
MTVDVAIGRRRELIAAPARADDRKGGDVEGGTIMMRSNGFGGRGDGRLAAEAKEKLPPPEEGRGEFSRRKS